LVGRHSFFNRQIQEFVDTRFRRCRNPRPRRPAGRPFVLGRGPDPRRRIGYCRIDPVQVLFADAIRHIEAAKRIARAAGLDVGGVEVVIDDRDGTPRFYDINAMSNFVADPLNVLGWDPHDRLIDFLEAQLKERQAA